MTEKKHFSLAEANAMIPHLLETVPQIQTLANRLAKDFPDIVAARQKSQENGGSLEGAAYLQTSLKLNKKIQGLESKGCILKGVSNGLVDFPTLRDGKLVYLCWKIPEKKIEYWHDVDAGFAGRQPI
ncbi:MAG: hypothetical protein COV67_06550 [Nitrospinae bacterium CG11_big_fil_rev_8_21_14_0_20_56_8]|nr:MAG: hypothetical protein COV67_06550 [Nitrospinae bacterium CG11_big_fil_rev_8_21_14_0_20_56_8]